MKTLIAVTLCLIFIGGTSTKKYEIFSIYQKSDTLKVHIGLYIENNKNTRSAKNFDKVKVGELFSIYIKPEKKVNVYVFNEMEKEIKVIIDTILTDSKLYVLPSEKNFFIFDGKFDIEKISILCTCNEELIKKIRKSGKTIQKELLKDIVKNLKINISEKREPIVNINGNLRNISQSEPILYQYSGINSIIKEYSFNVKK